MAEYTITLSPKNMKMLLDHVFIGHWVFTVNCTDDIEKKQEYDGFFETILAIMKNYNIAAEDINYDEQRGYTLTDAKNEILTEIMRNYNEHCYWEELITDLALRDAWEKHGKKLYDMDQDEVMRLRSKEIQKYIDEFSEHRIGRLRIQKKK
ncbi:MAG: hypothetical protein LBD29_01315 [Treponema sp.]|jgi:hypothetical protein|nr:hypothetical protein [Treponema sp.]